jgi:hypothetical protein
LKGKVPILRGFVASWDWTFCCYYGKENGLAGIVLKSGLRAKFAIHGAGRDFVGLVAMVLAE